MQLIGLGRITKIVGTEHVVEITWETSLHATPIPPAYFVSKPR